MNRQTLQLDLLQPLFESATNAADKGQAQYFTPVEFAKEIASKLPDERRTICDLTCGNGSLLAGCRNKTTHFTLGADLDGKCQGNRINHAITADLTLLYPLLNEIDWRCDCFALNPPWDLHWHRDRLQALADSEMAAVRESFTCFDSRLSSSTIDSTVAILMIALDRCSYRGEGVLIANASTVQRLIFADNAPHRALLRHIWARVFIDGNPCTDKKFTFGQRKLTLPDQPEPQPAAGTGPAFKTAVLYFAAGHDRGPDFPNTIANVNRRSRQGSMIYTGSIAAESHKQWIAAGEEYRLRHCNVPPPWNLSLYPDGTIRVYLSLFSEQKKDIADAAQRLYNLRGKHPMQLIMQRAERTQLLRELAFDLWKVDPQLKTAVELAVRDYHAQRAPLYPLPKTQRLGYLDEEDTIKCEKDFWPCTSPGQAPRRIFRAGRSYPLRSETVDILRLSERRNLEGEMEFLELSGRDLAFHITGEAGTEFTFVSDPSLLTHEFKERYTVFPIRDLIDHFYFPEVQDAAAVRPMAYQNYLNELSKLEKLTTC